MHHRPDISLCEFLDYSCCEDRRYANVLIRFCHLAVSDHSDGNRAGISELGPHWIFGYGSLSLGKRGPQIPNSLVSLIAHKETEMQPCSGGFGFLCLVHKPLKTVIRQVRCRM